MTDYRTIFEQVEATLLRVGGENVSEETIRQQLDESKKAETTNFSDDDYFRILVGVTFYSGMKAETVTRRMNTILRYFSDYKAVADYDEQKVHDILADKANMLCNEGKVRACIANAKEFKKVIEQWGSFQAYIESSTPTASTQNLMRLRRDLRRFKYLKKITSYHFLTEIGMPVLKPDRVIRRIFYRLGLVQSDGEGEEELTRVIDEGHQFREATKLPIRYIDRVFVAYGQVQDTDLGIQKGICLEDNPRCGICGVSKSCKYFARKGQA